MDKLTAETVTDDQIRALRTEAHRAGDIRLEDDCSDAVRYGVGRIATARKAARQRCADAINSARERAADCSTCGAIHDDVDCFGELVR